MAKQIFSKTIPLCLGVLAISLLLGYVVFAWTEPSVGPPGGNIFAPLNVGTSYQAKDGNLGLRTFYIDDINIGGTIPNLYSADGNLIVKDSSNNTTLEIDGSSGNMTIGGDITSVGDICLDNGCQSSWPSGGDSDWIISGNDIYSGVSGNVGIGTTVPGAKLSFNNLNDGTNGADGITWYNPSPTFYGIHRTSGSWLAPNYQQLRLGWSTGIILDPGSAYGKSYVDIQSGGLVVGNPTDGNKGAGTINAEHIYVGGSEIGGGGVIVTYQMSVASEQDGTQYTSKTKTFTCPSGTPTVTSFTGGDYCTKSINGGIISMTAKVETGMGESVSETACTNMRYWESYSCTENHSACIFCSTKSCTAQFQCNELIIVE